MSEYKYSQDDDIRSKQRNLKTLNFALFINFNYWTETNNILLLIYLGMYMVYQYQFPIFHAKLMVVGLWIVLFMSLTWGAVLTREIKNILKQDYINYMIPLDLILLYYAFFMLKGVSIKIFYLTIMI